MYSLCILLKPNSSPHSSANPEALTYVCPDPTFDLSGLAVSLRANTLACRRPCTDAATCNTYVDGAGTQQLCPFTQSCMVPEHVCQECVVGFILPFLHCELTCVVAQSPLALICVMGVGMLVE